MTDWKKWKRVVILMHDDGRVQVGKVTDDPRNLIGDAEVIHRTDEGFLLWRQRGRGKKNIYGTAIVGKKVTGTLLLCVETENQYGERRLDGMRPSDAKKWLMRLKKIKKRGPCVRQMTQGPRHDISHHITQDNYITCL